MFVGRRVLVQCFRAREFYAEIGAQGGSALASSGLSETLSKSQRPRKAPSFASEAVTTKLYKESIPRAASRIKELGLVTVRDLLNTLKMVVATDSQRKGMATEKKEKLEGMASLHVSQRA